MLVKLVAYVMLFNISLYCAIRTFKFINTCSLQEHTFILNNVKALSIIFRLYMNLLCVHRSLTITSKSIILCLTFLYWICYKSWHNNCQYMQISYHQTIHYKQHHGPKIFYSKVENNYYKYSLSFWLIMKIPSKVTTSHGIEHIMCMKKYSLVNFILFL